MNKGQILLLQNHPFSLVSPETVLKVIQNPSPTESEILATAAAPAGSSSDERGKRGSRAALLQEAVDNLTTIPDDLLFAPGTVPVLTIRDPRLAVPSAHRVLGAMGIPHGSGRPNFLISTSTLWVRGAYETYKARGIEPVVVDADDLMTGGPEFARSLCSRLGLDPEMACLSWDVPTAEERAGMHPAYYASQRFLIESSGVDAGRAAGNRNLEAEVEGWPAEFGEDVAMVREMVELAMPHYRYLHERRFKM
ncbi:hypothetical protein PG993_009184 [Apiospora rasikravindrae]|uniref:Uncharacterized protein n=1 Tax=Apiospora rasikravindrae TaxID=990691 RepID=A0ABR1SKG6_9PEZI